MSGAVVGVDVGGTFTDLILMEPATGAVRLAKVPSTPANQAAGVLAALDGAAASLAAVASIVHGTTVTTNALLERKLSRTGLVTTQGSATCWSWAGAPGPTPTASPAASRR